MHETPLISTIVAALVLAFILGALANRFRLPPLIGYLVAGVVVGPFTPGFIADQELALELSEIGVILLMFGVGLHFSLRDLISVQAVAIPGSLGRIVLGTLMGMGLGLLMGWPLFAGIILGLSLSVASTVVLLKALQDRHLLDSERGRIAVGWVVVEDVAMVLALVLIPALAPLGGGVSVAVDDPFVRFVERILRMELGLPGTIAVTVVKLAAFVGFMLVVGRRLIPMLLHYTAHTGSRELFRLAVLAIALGVAAGSAYLFGVSLALGAFFAGMILSESELSHRAAEETLPLRDAFSVLFFVAVGMLFDPSIFVRSPLQVLGVLFIVLIGKSVIAYLLMIAFKRSVSTALTVTASVAQVGEFSFVLAGLGITLGLLPLEGRDLILAAAMVSILVNPLMFWAADLLRPILEARFSPALAGAEPAAGRLEPVLMETEAAPPANPVAAQAQQPTSLEHHTVLIGYGRVGTVVGEGLQREGRPFVLVEDAEARVQAARAAGIETVVENAATAKAMQLANVKGADTIIVAIPNAFEAGQATEQSRKLNPSARIIARAHSDEEEVHLRHLGADGVIMGEREIGMGMLDLVRAVPLKPAATSVAVERALGKALEVPAPRSSLGPEPVAPAVAPVAAAASIEAALGRALDLKEEPEAPAEEEDRTILPIEDDSWLYEPAVEPLPETVAAADSEPGTLPLAADAADEQVAADEGAAIEDAPLIEAALNGADVEHGEIADLEAERIAAETDAAHAPVEAAPEVDETVDAPYDDEVEAAPVTEPYPDYWGTSAAPAAAEGLTLLSESASAVDPLGDAMWAGGRTEGEELAAIAGERLADVPVWADEPPSAPAEVQAAAEPGLPEPGPAEVPPPEPVTEPPAPAELPHTPDVPEVPPAPEPAPSPWDDPPRPQEPEIPAQPQSPPEIPLTSPEPAVAPAPLEVPPPSPPIEVPQPAEPATPGEAPPSPVAPRAEDELADNDRLPVQGSPQQP